MNDFNKDLQYSLSASMENFWDEVYKKAFVDLKKTQICSEKQWQLLGIDRFVYLKSGRIFAVDEKVRRSVYPDVLLEYTSADSVQSPGWINKQLAIDYLAYAFMPTKTVYLFDWPMLRRAWVHYGEIWKNKYPTIKADNGSYNTLSVAVPLKVITQEVKNATIIKL